MEAEMKDDCFLNVNWNDLEKNTHKVGFLCLYNDKYFFKIEDEETIPTAYNHGFVTSPGVQSGKIYVSKNELFDLLKKRLGIEETDESKISIMKSLISSKLENEVNSQGQITNPRDRISFDEMSEMQEKECKKEIDEYLLKLKEENKDQGDEIR